MRSDVTYTYVTDGTNQIQGGHVLNVEGSVTHVQILHKEPNIWSPNSQGEKEGAEQRVHLSANDARELAQMLLAAADHVDLLAKAEVICCGRNR